MESIFLGCFAFGAIFTLLTTVLGMLGAGMHGLGGGHGLSSHLPGHGGGHGGGHLAGHGLAQAAHGLGHAAGAAQHAAHGVAHGIGHAAGRLAPGQPGGQGLLLGLALSTLLNPSALLLGTSVFGGLGYLAMHNWLLGTWLALAVALPAGLGAATLVSAFMRKLREDAGTMQDGDYALAGTLALVTVSVAAGAVGEIVFELGGRRRGEGARACDGRAIAKGTEVVVLGYERGIALVEPMQQLAHEPSHADPDPLRRRESVRDENG